MEKMILSLKNIYMLLMTEDFPIYSESVIGRAERKGQTMLRFWQRQIVSEFRSQPCGRMIWRNDGKRNRYTSYLCNRSAEIKTYSEYARELASQICVSSLLNQINQFAEFLSASKYRHDILIRRVRELIRLVETEDPRVCGKIASHIRETASESVWQDRGSHGQLFQAAYLLTIMMLYAAAGEAMDNPVMTVLRTEAHGIEALWSARTQHQKAEPSQVRFLTVHSGLLQDNPLPIHRFFGREEALFDLKEMASNGGKCLITGLGGMGKTELMRQLIRVCTQERVVDQIAVIPYHVSIAKSFALSFLGSRRQDPAEYFPKLLRQLEQEIKTHKLLVVIDDLTNGMEEDPDLAQLLTLDCAVLITSRRGALEGFQTFRLEKPSASAGTLIFRDNYGSVLNREDQRALTQIMNDDALSQPLTLRLLAKAAGSRKWSVEFLMTQLQKGGAAVILQVDQTVRMARIYRQLYSYGQIPEECQPLAELFTLLPRDSFRPDFLQITFPQIVGSGAAAQLETLADRGWLETSADGYSMHPLIAQCLRRTVLNEAVTAPVLNSLRQKIIDSGPIDGPVEREEDFLRCCGILAHIVGILGGGVSPELLTAFANSVSVSEHTSETISRYEKLLRRLKKRSGNWNDTAEAAYWRTLCRWRRGEAEPVKALYLRQKQHRTVPDILYFDFCLAAGYFLKYQQETDLAGELFHAVLEQETHPVQKATAYFYMYELTQITGDQTASARWGREGANYVRAHPECGPVLTFTNLFAMGAGSLKFQKEDTLEALTAMKAVLTDTSPDWCKAQYAALAGTYELLYGSPEAALEHYLWQKNYILEYQGKCYSYYNTLGQIGQVLRRLKRYGEAAEVYQEILSFAQKGGHTALHQRICCHLSGVYLDLDRPEEALLYLRDAVEEGRAIGGLPLGEALWSAAEVYRQLGNTKEEFTFLAEAAPLLEGAYGKQHPKVQSAWQRLDEHKEEETKK